MLILQARLPCCTSTWMRMQAMKMNAEVFTNTIRGYSLIPHLCILIPSMVVSILRETKLTPLPKASWASGVIFGLSFIFAIIVSVSWWVSSLNLLGIMQQIEEDAGLLDSNPLAGDSLL